MAEAYFHKQQFNKSNFLAPGEYENCVFTGCDLSNSNLSGFIFIDCAFIGCNLSLIKLNNTALREVKFRDCKLLGLRFDTCHDFGLSFSFEGCQLNHSVFYRKKIIKTSFINCQLHGVDFTEADLTTAVFDFCDLSQAVFDRSILEKVDFRTALNYTIDPEANRIRKARFSLSGISGLLGKYDINIQER
ncbi:MAG TPA: pentapeptide repeat-containing protein [Cyclobacteriaceae bacterium]|nr:pentapeptide repeat-containing protein [Cyclobacteriaceae bacterium]